MPGFKYWKCCVEFPTQRPKYEALIQTIEENREITRRTFLKHVDKQSPASVERQLGYEKWPAKGLTMAGDFHVSYHRANYRGTTVYYFRYSAIEHIFVPEDFDESL